MAWKGSKEGGKETGESTNGEAPEWGKVPRDCNQKCRGADCNWHKMGNIRQTFPRQIISSPDDEESDEGTDDEEGALDPRFGAVAFEPAASKMDTNDRRGGDCQGRDECAEEGNGESAAEGFDDAVADERGGVDADGSWSRLGDAEDVQELFGGHPAADGHFTLDDGNDDKAAADGEEPDFEKGIDENEEGLEHGLFSFLWRLGRGRFALEERLECFDEHVDAEAEDHASDGGAHAFECGHHEGE